MRHWRRHGVFLHRMEHGVMVVFVSGTLAHQHLIPALGGFHDRLPPVCPLVAPAAMVRADGSLDPHLARFAVTGLERLGVPEPARLVERLYRDPSFEPLDLFAEHVDASRCIAALPPALWTTPAADLCLAAVPASLREVSLVGVLAHLVVELRTLTQPVCIVLDETFRWLANADTRALLAYLMPPWVPPTVELLLLTRTRAAVPLDAPTTVLTGDGALFLTRLLPAPTQRRAGWTLDHFQGDEDDETRTDHEESDGQSRSAVSHAGRAAKPPAADASQPLQAHCRPA